MTVNDEGTLNISHKIEGKREELLLKLEEIKAKLDNDNSAFNEFWEECRYIELKLKTHGPLSEETLINCSYKIISLNKRVEKKILPPGVALLFILIILLYGCLIIYIRSQTGTDENWWTTLSLFLTKLLIGIVGFMAYFFSNLMKHTRNILINMLFAAIFPLILVSVFSSDFKTINLASLDFLCLAAGFNVGIVLKFLGVIVEKTNKFIEKL